MSLSRRVFAVLFLVCLLPYQGFAQNINMQAILKPIKDWERNMAINAERSKEMPGTVYISAGTIKTLDCEKNYMEVKPNIGNMFHVTFSTIQDIRVKNFPGYCKTVEWLAPGKRIDIVGRYKWKDKKNIVYRAKLLPKMT